MQTTGIAHIIAAYFLTVVAGAGLLGIGTLMRGRTIGERWILGWTGLWWSVALTAQFIGVNFAVYIGVIALLFGSASLLLSWWKKRAGIAATPSWPPIVLLTLGTAGGFLWLAPPFFYDTLAYHLGLPWSWIISDTFSPLPEIVMSYYPVAGQTIYLLPASLGFPEVAAGLHFITFVIALLAVTNIARQLGAGRYAPLAMLPLCCTWHMLWVAGLAAVDHLVTLGILVAVEALTGSASESKNPEIRRWMIAGLGLGLAMASKYPALVIVAAILIAAVVVYPRCFHLASLCFAIAMAASSFHWIRNIVLTGNPIYPLLPSIFGIFSWTEIDAVRYMAYGTEPYGFSVLVDGLNRLIVPPGGFGWWILILIPLVFVPFFTTTIHRRALLFAGLSSVLIFSLWMILTTRLIRFAFPGAALIAVLIAVGINQLSRRFRPWALAVFSVLMLHGFALFFSFVSGTLQMSDLWLQRISADEWRYNVTVNDPTRAYRYCASLPPESRIFVIGEGRPWGLDIDHHISSAYEIQLIEELVMAADTTEELATMITGRGFTHMLINWAELSRLKSPPVSLMNTWSTADELRWRHFLEEHTNVEWRDELLEIRGLK